MGNIPLPFQDIVPNSASVVDKRLLIWKVTSISACFIGTVVYMRPVEPYIEAQYFGILVPAIITGYIIINSSEIFALYMKQEHIFVEVCFAMIGALASSVCSIYQLYRWIEWTVYTSNDVDKDHGIYELVLAITCIIHAASLSAVVIERVIEYSQYLNEND